MPLSEKEKTRDRMVTLTMTESRLLWLTCVMYDRNKDSMPERDHLARKLREALK